MASKKRDLTSDEIVDISSEISKISRGSTVIEKRIQNILSQGAKLSKVLTKDFKKVQSEMISSSRKLSKELDDITKKEKILTNQEKKKLELLEKELKSNKNKLQILDRIIDKNEDYAKSNDKIGKAFNTIAPKASGFFSSLGAGAAAIAGLGPLGIAAAAGMAILSAGISLVSSAFEGLTSLYDNWFQLQEKWVASQAQLTTQAGLTEDQLDSARDSIEALTGTMGDLTSEVDGIQITTQYITQMAQSFREVNRVTPELARSMITLNRGFGLSGDQANRLFRLVTTGVQNPIDEINRFGAEMMDFADQIGAPAGVLMRDYERASSNIAEFGRDGERTFRDAALMANRFGFEAQKIFEMVKKFDTFQSAANNVNTLNSMFGTTISSFEMMMAQDPTERLEMLRNAIMQTGQSWEDMTRFQRMQLADTLGVSVDDAMRMFRDNVSFDNLDQERRQRQREQEENDRVNQDNARRMNDLLIRTGEVFESWQRQLQRIKNELSEALGPVFEVIHEIIVDTGREIADWIKSWAKSEDAQQSVRDLAYDIKEFILEAKDYILEMDWTKQVRDVRNMVDAVKAIAGGIQDAILAMRYFSALTRGDEEEANAIIRRSAYRGHIPGFADASQMENIEAQMRVGDDVARSLRERVNSGTVTSSELEVLRNPMVAEYLQEAHPGLVSDIREYAQGGVLGRTQQASISSGNDSRVIQTNVTLEMDGRRMGEATATHMVERAVANR